MSLYGVTTVNTIAQRDALPQTQDMFVYVEDVEICYQLKGSTWETYFTGGAVPVGFGLDPAIGLPGGGSGGGGTGPATPITYTNATPTPNVVGGIDAGSTFDAVTLPDMWTKLLYAYQPPAFTAFSITSVPTVLEVGQTIPSGAYNFTWTLTNTSNVAPNSINIIDQTQGLTLKTGVDIVSPESVSLAAMTKTTAVSNVWRLSATSITSATLTRDFTASWRWGVMHGESALTVLANSDIQSLRVKTIKSAVTGNYVFIAGNYKYICYPTSMGLKTVFKDVSTNLDVAMEAPYVVSSTNAHGVTTDYYVHRSTNTLGGAITINVIS